jgi:NAD(P)-dependent dehydrogenase (short-subunit alcohol dehydrogenase family)
MKARREGSIVYVSTRSTMQPLAGEGPYVAAKTALLGVSRQLAMEFGPYNIRVNSPRMGWLWGDPVRSYLTAKAEKRGVPLDEVVAEIVRDIPLGVIPPDEECARSVLFFLSDHARMVTGTSLDINGGQFMM